MGSTRLPGKVLADVGGRPMLAFQLARLRLLEVDHLVVATTTLERDNPVAELAAVSGAEVVRGSEADVLARFLAALDAHPSDVVVRLTADCPLADPSIVYEALALRAALGADYASNSLVRTFPVGLDTEVMTADALRAAAAEARDPAEREHVTPFIHRRPERFRLAALRVPDLLGDERWTVDTPADLDRVRDIVARLDNPLTAGWREVLAVAGRLAVPQPGKLHLRPAVAADDAVLALPGGEPLGTGEPPLPIEPYLIDSSVRTWIATVDDAPVGWLQMRVRSGIGRLTGCSKAEWREAVLGGLRTALKADYQARGVRV